MKIGLITDNGTVAEWQAQALETIQDSNEFLIYNCTTLPSHRRSPTHAFYYLLNLISLRSKLTARAALPSSLCVSARLDFEAECVGQWQKLPPSVLQRIKEDGPTLLIKFGMGLLAVPPTDQLSCPILSYHHGDPREFRGRPAGFYELMLGREVVGQTIQILSNSLDAGRIVAFGETRALKHSYRSTMKLAYRSSPLLLRKAIQNLIAGNALPIQPTGKAYRLPTNLTVLGFFFKSLARMLRHMAYGAFFEKSWAVAEAPSSGGATMLSTFPDSRSWRALARSPDFRFLADPFYHPDGDGILVEALRRSTGRGEIILISAAGQQSVSDSLGHYSYPSTITVDGKHFLLPEISEWSPPILFGLRGPRLERLGELKIPGRPRLIDPTLHAHGEMIFLFANRASEGDSILRLWFSDALLGEFAEHPSSPIHISPAGGRMAGAIVMSNGHRFRLGQDSRRQYGDGMILFRIDELSRSNYRETAVDQLRFASTRGPHTLNFRGDSMVFDHYRNRFSLLAGARRLRSRFADSRKKLE